LVGNFLLTEIAAQCYQLSLTSYGFFPGEVYKKSGQGGMKPSFSRAQNKKLKSISKEVDQSELGASRVKQPGEVGWETGLLKFYS
jgi:hypothetical protein